MENVILVRCSVNSPENKSHALSELINENTDIFLVNETKLDRYFANTVFCLTVSILEKVFGKNSFLYYKKKILVTTQVKLHKHILQKDLMLTLKDPAGILILKSLSVLRSQL